MRRIVAVPLSVAVFAPFGDVVEAHGDANDANQGRARRFDLPFDLGTADPRAPRLGTAIYRVRASAWPFRLVLVERHPLSPQLFFPNAAGRFLVCACPDAGDGVPDLDRVAAFVGTRHQGIVWRRGAWHSSLAALDTDGDFLMQQWQGGGALDCEEWPLPEPMLIEEA
jgi:ureidoglycolate lyase